MTDERKANTLTDAQEMAEAYCNTVNHILKSSETIAIN
jgi:hypothetical protein